MSAAYQFAVLVALENAEARTEVIEFGHELHATDLAAWERGCQAADRAGKPRPERTRSSQDPRWCREKSRAIRIKRERNETYFNQTTNPNPTY